MLLNGKEINNLIIDGEKFSKNGGKLNVVNHQALTFRAKPNGNIVLLSDTDNDLSAYLNKQIILFYAFQFLYNDSSQAGYAAVTESFKFTGYDTVPSVTNDGDILVTYYSYSHELTVNCQSQWAYTQKITSLGIGMFLEIAE